MSKTLQNFSYAVNADGTITASAVINDAGNLMNCAVTFQPEKSGAAFAKQLTSFLSDYIKEKYGCEK